MKGRFSVKKRFHIIVDGRVQGVGFRYFATTIANQLGLTGTVHNMQNGMVEIFVQGNEEAIDQFIIKIQQGNRFIMVTDLRCKEVELNENERQFRCIDYYF